MGMLAAGPLAAILGAVGGSFAVTAALRAAGGRSALTGRSQCDGCGATLGLGRTIPLANYALQGGRGHCCGGAIPVAHPIAEAAGASSAAVAVAMLPAAQWPAAIGLAMLLIFIAAYDVRTLKIFDLASAGVAGLGLLAALQRGAPGGAVIGALMVGALLFSAAELFRRVRGKAGLGGGDVKLAAALCLWTGPGLAGVALIASCAAALIWTIALRPPERIAFAPFLALGFWVVGLVGAAA